MAYAYALLFGSGAITSKPIVEDVPAEALAFNGEPLTFNGEYITYGSTGGVPATALTLNDEPLTLNGEYITYTP